MSMMSNNLYELKVRETSKYHNSLILLDIKYANYFDKLLQQKALILSILKQNYLSKINIIDEKIKNDIIKSIYFESKNNDENNNNFFDIDLDNDYSNININNSNNHNTNHSTMITDTNDEFDKGKYN